MRKHTLFTNSPYVRQRQLPLQSLIASNVAEFDATLASCFVVGDIELRNHCPSPADGSAQTDYDMYHGDTAGVSSKDPTFVGNTNDPASYFTFDGTQFFSIKTGTTSPAFLKDLHREDAAHPSTLMMAFRYVDNGALYNFAGNNSGAGQGFRLQVNTTDKPNVRRVTATDGDDVASTLTLVNGTDYLMAFTIGGEFDAVLGAARSIKFSINGASFTAAANMPIATVAGTNNVSSTGTFSVGATNKLVAVPSGFRMYGFYMFNEVLSDAQLATIAQFLEFRHQRDYTP